MYFFQKRLNLFVGDAQLSKVVVFVDCWGTIENCQMKLEKTK